MYERRIAPLVKLLRQIGWRLLRPLTILAVAVSCKKLQKRSKLHPGRLIADFINPTSKGILKRCQRQQECCQCHEAHSIKNKSRVWQPWIGSDRNHLVYQEQRHTQHYRFTRALKFMSVLYMKVVTAFLGITVKEEENIITVDLWRRWTVVGGQNQRSLNRGSAETHVLTEVSLTGALGIPEGYYLSDISKLIQVVETKRVLSVGTILGHGIRLTCEDRPFQTHATVAFQSCELGTSECFLSSTLMVDVGDLQHKLLLATGHCDCSRWFLIAPMKNTNLFGQSF